MRTSSTPAWARAGTVAAVGSLVVAVGCTSAAPFPSEAPAQPVAVERPPAECDGRAECTRVCIAGEVRRCIDAGLSWERSDGVTSFDLVKAAELHQRACDAGIGEGCLHVEALIKDLRAGCDEAVADRCTDLGYVYEHGIGLITDLHYAAHFYKMACDARAPLGCSRLGTLYDEGRGVDTSWATAARLYAKACEGGVAAGCGDLGYLYERGRGVRSNEKRARELYREGCERGSGTACMKGEVLERGQAARSASQKAPASARQALVGPSKP